MNRVKRRETPRETETKEVVDLLSTELSQEVLPSVGVACLVQDACAL